MGGEDSGNDVTDVVEHGTYSEVGTGPATDTSSFDKATPMAGARYRDDLKLAPEVILGGDADGKDPQPKMISRDSLSGTAMPPAVREATCCMTLLINYHLSTLLEEVGVHCHTLPSY